MVEAKSPIPLVRQPLRQKAALPNPPSNSNKPPENRNGSPCGRRLDSEEGGYILAGVDAGIPGCNLSKSQTQRKMGWKTAMKNFVIDLSLMAFLSLSAGELALFAQENPQAGAPKASASIQQQIDELKVGQERLLKELEEIKKLLQEKQPLAVMPGKPTAPSPISLNVHGEPFRGDGRAKVGMMEYSDFECSFCGKYAREIYPKIDKDYIQTGKVKYFFRDLPAPEHANALLAARAARCAGEQGKFWEMHDLLFVAQSALAEPDLASHAQALGLEAGKFGECLSSGRYSNNIRMSIAGARRIGIYGTPAFLVGTVTEDGDFLRTTNVLLGGESLEMLKSSLDELLAPPPISPPKQ